MKPIPVLSTLEMAETGEKLLYKSTVSPSFATIGQRVNFCGRDQYSEKAKNFLRNFTSAIPEEGAIIDVASHPRPLITQLGSRCPITRRNCTTRSRHTILAVSWIFLEGEEGPVSREISELTGRELAADNDRRLIRSILLRRRWRHGWEYAGEDTRESTQIRSMGCITKEEVRVV